MNPEIITFIYIINCVLNLSLYEYFIEKDTEKDINPVGIMIIFLSLIGTLTFLCLIIGLLLHNKIKNK